jgi:hypothetical protein
MHWHNRQCRNERRQSDNHFSSEQHLPAFFASRDRYLGCFGIKDIGNNVKKATLRNYDLPSGLKNIVRVSDLVTQVVYTDRTSLCSALCRIEEHYESPEFKGKVFTLGQYKKWYSAFYGAWTYHYDWSGFNIPSAAFEPFFNGLFDPLTPAEQELVDLFRHKEGPFCVIGTFIGCDPDVYEHEICHAMYSTDPLYKLQVDAALADHLEELAPLKKVIIEDLGYNEAVAMDECHAYICESSSWLDEKKIPYPAALKEKLQGIKAHFKK